MHDQPPLTSDLPLPPPPEETPAIRAFRKCWEAMKEEELDINQGFGIAALLVRNLVRIATVGSDSAETSDDLVRLFLHKLGAALPGTIRETTVPEEAPRQPTKLQRRRLKLGGN